MPKPSGGFLASFSACMRAMASRAASTAFSQAFMGFSPTGKIARAASPMKRSTSPPRSSTGPSTHSKYWLRRSRNAVRLIESASGVESRRSQNQMTACSSSLSPRRICPASTLAPAARPR
jgi:hypothetical protein